MGMGLSDLYIIWDHVSSVARRYTCDKMIIKWSSLLWSSLQVEAALHIKQNVVPASEYYTPYEEALHHTHFCQSKIDTFCGQTEVLKKIKDALLVRFCSLLVERCWRFSFYLGKRLYLIEALMTLLRSFRRVKEGGKYTSSFGIYWGKLLCCFLQESLLYTIQGKWKQSHYIMSCHTRELAYFLSYMPHSLTQEKSYLHVFPCIRRSDMMGGGSYNTL